MSKWPHLPKAPITEALIDIRVQLPAGSDMNRMSRFRDDVRADYPNCRERRQCRGLLTFTRGEPPRMETGSEGPDGYLLASMDNVQVVQARLDGFTFSRMRPYKDWQHLRDSARGLWELYRKAADPLTITRVAVRYINRIELPLLATDLLGRWVSTAPRIAQGLPQRLTRFFMKLSIPFESPPGFVNVTEAIEPGEHADCVPVIFDIDAFLPGAFRPDDEALWRRFEDLREIKNDVFFRSIPPEVVEWFQ